MSRYGLTATPLQATSSVAVGAPGKVTPGNKTRPLTGRPTGNPLGYHNPLARGGDPRLQGSTGVDPRLQGSTGTDPRYMQTPQIAPLPSGLPNTAAQSAPPGNSGMNFQMNQAGLAGLNSMGIPAPPTYNPRDPMAPLVNPNIYGQNNAAGVPQQSAYAPNTSNMNAAQAAVDRYTNGVIHTSLPVAPGSAHNAGIGGPNAQAVLGGQINQMKNDQMLQAFGGRGGMATTDYGYDASGQRRLANYTSGEYVMANGNIFTPGVTNANPTQAAPGTVPGAAGGASPNSTSPSGQAGASGGVAAPTSTSGNNAQYDMLNTLAQSADERQRAAEEANEQRYRDILSGYGSRFDRNMGTLEGMGDAEKASINRQFNALQSRNLQDAVGRGLAGTNILPGMRTLTERERTQELGNLNERLRRERIGLDTSLSGDTLGFMERRDDVGPNMDDLIRLAEGLGRSGDADLITGGQGFDNFPGGYSQYGFPGMGGGQQFNPQQLAAMQAGGNNPNGQAILNALRQQWQNQQIAQQVAPVARPIGAAASQYGQSLASLIPQAAQAVGGYFNNPGSSLSGMGNSLSSGLMGAASAPSNFLGGLASGLGGLANQLGSYFLPGQTALNAGRTASSNAASAIGGGLGSAFTLFR